MANDSIHQKAAAILVGDSPAESLLQDGEYSYRVSGSGGGHLFYKKQFKNGTAHWILIANWCFYGAYIVIRYRKRPWLQPMYRALFRTMGFPFISFNQYNIEAVDRAGRTVRSRRFQLTRPGGFKQVFQEKFNFSNEEAEKVTRELGL